MPKVYKEKYNDGCIKAFKFLLLLYKDEAYYDDVMDIFAENKRNEKQHVTLNKYLNALKIFGIKVEKINHKFVLKNMPFAVKFSKNDIKAISVLTDALTKAPNEKVKTLVENFIKVLGQRFDNNASILFEEMSKNIENSSLFFYKDLSTQIKQCEKYIKDNHKLSLTYSVDGKTVNTICSAKEMIYDNKNAYLRVYKTKENTIEDILITNILSVNYLPSQSSNIELTKTIIYRLKGRLAKCYIPKEGEEIREYCEDGSIVVVNKEEPINKLLSRLMRYDNLCVIERPKELREKMQNLISDTLKNYE